MFEKTLGFEEVERGKRLGLSLSTALVLQFLFLAFLVLHSVLASPNLVPPILNLEMSFLEPPAIKPPAAAGGAREVKLVKREEIEKPKPQTKETKGLTAPVVVPNTIDKGRGDRPAGPVVDGNGPGNGNQKGVPGGIDYGKNSIHKVKRTILPPWKVSPPRLLKKVDPVYPAPASAMGITGWVVLQVVVDENGRVESAKVLESSNAIFEKPSLDAVRKWVYSKPTGSDGQRVACYLMIKLRFEL